MRLLLSTTDHACLTYLSSRLKGRTAFHRSATRQRRPYTVKACYDCTHQFNGAHGLAGHGRSLWLGNRLITTAAGGSECRPARKAGLSITARRPASSVNGPTSRSTDDKTQPNSLSYNVKAIMRHVPHPVVVITSTDTTVGTAGTPEAWRGITVSSFNTVTLAPRPIVSFNIKKLSATYDAIKSSGLFNVHLFSRTEASIVIAQRFSRGNASSPFYEEDGSLANFARSKAGPLKGQSCDELDVNPEPPIINTSPEPQFVLRCTNLPQKTIDIEDHVVLVGEVTDGFAELDQAGESAVFLSYANGEYL